MKRIIDALRIQENYSVQAEVAANEARSAAEAEMIARAYDETNREQYELYLKTSEKNGLTPLSLYDILSQIDPSKLSSYVFFQWDGESSEEVKVLVFPAADSAKQQHKFFALSGLHRTGVLLEEELNRSIWEQHPTEPSLGQRVFPLDPNQRRFTVCYLSTIIYNGVALDPLSFNMMASHDNIDLKECDFEVQIFYSNAEGKLIPKDEHPLSVTKMQAHQNKLISPAAE